jgi:hypothetical protein
MTLTRNSSQPGRPRKGSAVSSDRSAWFGAACPFAMLETRHWVREPGLRAPQTAAAATMVLLCVAALLSADAAGEIARRYEPLRHTEHCKWVALCTLASCCRRTCDGAHVCACVTVGTACRQMAWAARVTAPGAERLEGPCWSWRTIAVWKAATSSCGGGGGWREAGLGWLDALTPRATALQKKHEHAFKLVYTRTNPFTSKPIAPLSQQQSPPVCVSTSMLVQHPAAHRLATPHTRAAALLREPLHAGVRNQPRRDPVQGPDSHVPLPSITCVWPLLTGPPRRQPCNNHPHPAGWAAHAGCLTSAHWTTAQASAGGLRSAVVSSSTSTSRATVSSSLWAMCLSCWCAWVWCGGRQHEWDGGQAGTPGRVSAAPASVACKAGPHTAGTHSHSTHLDDAVLQLCLPKEYHEGDSLLQGIVQLVTHLGVGLLRCYVDFVI